MKHLKTIIILLSITHIAFSQALSIQGVLRDNDGKTVSDGARNFDFVLYEDLTGGTALWCETQTLTVTNGVYSATLGDENNGSCTNDELSDLDFGQPYYLGISIDGAEELGPRTKLTLSPYAIIAQVDGQDNIFPQTGSVGIGTTNPANQLDVVGSIDASKNISADSSITAGGQFIGNGTIPVGGIIMWSGAISDIPSSWALCDGTNGTPNLKNRFIVGAGDDYSVEDTGGQDSVTLTADEMPAHNHDIDIQHSTPNNSESYYSTNTFLRFFRRSGDSAYGDDADAANFDTGSSGYYEAWKIPKDTESAGGDDTHENRPPYFALAFIMRTE